jgi:hypothetical protein
MDNEYDGFKQRLKEAKLNSEKLKIVFQYPNSTRLTIRKGNVLKVDEKSFDFKDRFDGDMTFSFNFIVEIGVWDGE